MTTIDVRVNCGNSPKSRLLVDLITAIAVADESTIAALVTADVAWHPVGRKAVHGQQAFCKAITRYGAATAVAVEHVLTHGAGGAIDGIVEFGDKRRAFCYVVDFASAKGSQVRRLTSYSVALG